MQRPLPLLPGNSFWVPKDRNHKSQIFSIKNGLPVINEWEDIPEDDSTIALLQSMASTTASNATHRKANTTASKSGKDWLALDRKVLRFFGYFKETVVESALERERMRKVVIYFYLEDSTLAVFEPRQDNSGITQGALIKRQRVPKEGAEGEYVEMADMNVGKVVTIYGKSFRLYDCDKFTRAFLTEYGMDVPNAENAPLDEYTKKRFEQSQRAQLTTETQELKSYMEFVAKGRRTAYTKAEQLSVQQFLLNDRKVLRFYTCWDDRESLYGDFRLFVLYYFLSDDTIQISEVSPPNSGRDPFPVFVRRQKCPKDFTDKFSSDFYTWQDLGIGKTVTIFNRKFLLYDCDEFTKEFLSEMTGETSFEPIDVELEKPAPIKVEPPPYNGFGSEEDSLGSWLYLVLKPPKRNMKKLLEFDRKVLRFAARLDTDKPEDIDRQFYITFYLADDTISVFEPSQRNSGIIGGRFLSRQRVKHPSGTGYYTAQDLYVGAKLNINSHIFELTSGQTSGSPSAN